MGETLCLTLEEVSQTWPVTSADRSRFAQALRVVMDEAPEWVE